MNATHNGVLLPEDMRDATIADKDAYAEKVKVGNRTFIDAYFTLEDRAQELGLELDGCERCGLFVPCERHAEV